MSYFADSSWDYVGGKIELLRRQGDEGRLLVTVPHLPSAATLALAQTFTSRSIACDVALTFKIADVVWKPWPHDQQDLARSRDWLDELESP